MDPVLMAALIGGGLGLGKSYLIDQPAADRQRKVAAIEATYSPWTGIKPEPVKEADPFGSALQYGATGAMLEQGAQQTDKTNSLMDSQKNYLDSQTAANGPVYQPGFGFAPTRNAMPYGSSYPWMYVR